MNLTYSVAYNPRISESSSLFPPAFVPESMTTASSTTWDSRELPQHRRGLHAGPCHSHLIYHSPLLLLMPTSASQVIYWQISNKFKFLL